MSVYYPVAIDNKALTEFTFWWGDHSHFKNGNKQREANSCLKSFREKFYIYANFRNDVLSYSHNWRKRQDKTSQCFLLNKWM